MLRYFIRRLLWACVLFVAVTLVTFVIFFVIPADPARQTCGQRATPECIARAQHFLGTRSAGARPVRPLPRPARRCTSRSAARSRTARTSRSEVLQAAPVTASLVFGGAVLWLMISIPIGILSALRPRSLLDRVTMVRRADRHLGASRSGSACSPRTSAASGCTSSRSRATASSSRRPATAAGPIAVGLPPDAAVGDVRRALRSDVRADDPRVRDRDARRGLRAHRAREGRAPRRRVLRSHVVRNALLPVVTILGMDIGLALGGAFFTETRLRAAGARQARGRCDRQLRPADDAGGGRVRHHSASSSSTSWSTRSMRGSIPRIRLT